MTNQVDLSIDNFPPGRVTDLAVANALNTVILNFTSPGDDLDSNEPVASYVIKYSSTAGNLSGVNFDNEEFNVEISGNDLVDSDLSPVDGGAAKKINIKSSTKAKNQIQSHCTNSKDQGQSHHTKTKGRIVELSNLSHLGT